MLEALKAWWYRWRYRRYVPRAAPASVPAVFERTTRINAELNELLERNGRVTSDDWQRARQR